MNALISITEINSLYDQRPIIEKQASYAFYHPFAEALGGILSDIPVKFVAAAVFNIIYYFLAGLVRMITTWKCGTLTGQRSEERPLNSSYSSCSPSLAR